MQGLVTTGKQMAALLVPDIKTLGVNPQQPFHPGHQIGVRGFQHQMKMIPHQAPGMDLPLRFAARLGQGRQKHPAVHRIAKNRLPAIPPVHHVVDRPGIFTAHLSRHGRQPAKIPPPLSIV